MQRRVDDLFAVAIGPLQTLVDAVEGLQSVILRGLQLVKEAIKVVPQRDRVDEELLLL